MFCPRYFHYKRVRREGVGSGRRKRRETGRSGGSGGKRREAERSGGKWREAKGSKEANEAKGSEGK
jgi:hypothetical protein